MDYITQNKIQNQKLSNMSWIFSSHQAYPQLRSQSQSRCHRHPNQSASLSNHHQRRSKLRSQNSSSVPADSVLGSLGFGLEQSSIGFWLSSTQNAQSSFAWGWTATGKWEQHLCFPYLSLSRFCFLLELELCGSLCWFSILPTTKKI